MPDTDRLLGVANKADDLQQGEVMKSTQEIGG
jgi:hypothetical protein